MAEGTQRRDERIAAEAARRRVLVNGAVSWIITLAGNACAYIAYRPVAPRALVEGWGHFVAALLVFWAILMIVAHARRRQESIFDPELKRQRLILEIWTWLTVLGVTWLLMPYGTVELQLVTLLFVTCYTATTVISSADQPDTLAIRVAVVLGSVAAVTVWQRLPYWPFVVTFLAVFALSLFALAQLLERNVQSLRKSRIAAEAERDARTRFLASASHDLSQPLQASRLFFDQALRATDAKVAARAASDARLAFDTIERLLRQILDHLRLEAGDIAPVRQPVELAPIIAAILTQYSAAAEFAGAKLKGGNVRGRVMGDADLIERCVGNLVDNAIRHADATRILVGVRSQRGRTRVYVVDDGRGVHLEQRQHMFELNPPFDAESRQRGGFGIGLSSVRRAMALMGGDAQIDPRWRKGSAFFLDLPAS